MPDWSGRTHKIIFLFMRALQMALLHRPSLIARDCLVEAANGILLICRFIN